MAFDASRSQLLQGARNPAAPAGLRQTQQRQARDQQNYSQGRTTLRPWMPQSSQLETAKQWYTGANNEGKENGWDTTFYRNAFSQYDQFQKRAMDSGKASTFYGWLDPGQNNLATGVQTWGDDPTQNTDKNASRFGDVWNNGKKVANLYDDYDKATADVMIGEFLFTNDEKDRAWNKPGLDPTGRPTLNPEYSEMVETRRKENTDRALYAKSAESYDENVRARERALREGRGDEAVVGFGALGGIITGAGAGAAIGSVVPGIGTAVGAVVGGIIGGVAGGAGAGLNQDQLVEMSARAQEKADIANKDLGSNWLQRSTMQLGEYSRLGTRFLSPFSNIVQGATDAKYGDVGDMTSEFYAVDDQGNRKVGAVGKGADIVATLGDGVLQYASPAGFWATTAAQTGTVIGGISEMTTGTVFNDRRGQYDNLDGWQEWASAIGSTSIDAVQLGAAGGFAKAARSSRGLITGEKAASSKAGREATGGYHPDEASWVDKAFTKGQGTTRVDANGARFVRGESGEVLSIRPTMAALAPSEALRWVETGYRARKLARIDGGEMTRDHVLKAAMDLQQMGRFRTAVLMGYTEGGEEFAQAILDPMRTGDRVQWGDAFEAYLYGAAGGAGMALGPNNRGASTKQQVEMQAYVQHTMRTGQEMTPAEWKDFTKGWKPKDFQRVANTTAQENKETQDVLKTLADNQRQDSARNSAVGFARMEQVRADRSEALHRKALEEGNGSLVLKGQTSEYLTTSAGTVEKNKFGANSAVMSAREAIHQLDLIADGHKAQLDRVNEELAQLPVTADDDNIARLRQDAEARKADLEAQAPVSRTIADTMLRMYRDFVNERDPGLLERHVERMNDALRKAYTGQLSVADLPVGPDTQQRIQRAVELKLGRHPFIDRGSFAVAMPQISVELTKLNAHSEIYLQQGMLKAMNADHDGDTVVPLHMVYETEANLARLRRGDQYMEVTEDEDKVPKVKVVISNPDSEWAFLDSFKEAMRDPNSWSATTLTGRLNTLVTEIKAEFSDTSGGPLPAKELNSLLATFKESVRAGREDSRMNLVTDMVNLDYTGMRNHQNADGVPNVQWLWAKINEAWDITQKDLAHVRSTEATRPTVSPQREAQESTIRSTIARGRARTASASLGLLASDPVRGAQHLHYNTLYRSLSQYDRSATMTTQQQIDLTRLFLQLGTGQTQRDIDLLTGRNAIEERVYHWLGMMANSVSDTARSTPETMLLLANMSVPAIDMVLPNEYQVVEGEITMLQLLLRRSLDIERAKHRAAEPDSDIVKKINKLDRLTRRDPDRSKHSTTASLAMIEVMGDRPLHELVGSDSAYISPQITLNQLVQQERGLHPRVRSDEIHRLTRSPAYIKDPKRTFGDPPWPVSALTEPDPPINAYAMLVDAVKTAGDTYLPMLKDRDKTVQKNFINGLAGLHQELNAHRAKHSERLSANGRVEMADVLHDLLANDTALAADIGRLIPEAAALGVFQVRDGRVTQSKWLEDVLTNEDYEKAAATYYLHVKLAEFNQLSGTINADALTRLEGKDPGAILELEDVRGRIDPSTLTSRFLQVFTHLASQSDLIEASRFLRDMSNAPSIDAMFAQINKEPMWRNNQAELLPWHDDVSDFEVNPADVWRTQMDGALQRENIRGWGERMQIRGSIAAEAANNFEQNKATLHGMDQWLRTKDTDTPIDMHDGAQNIGLLNKAIRNRRDFPDYQGQVARSQLVELQQMGLAAVQNKGVADPKAAPYGEPLITLDSFGWSDGLRQEIASLTAEDVEDVLPNLTLLADGPVRMMMADGSILTFDITTDEKALAMLMDPRTQGLAMAVLFPTVRDVNTSNVVQTYLDTDARTASDSNSVLSTLLKEQSYKHLFQTRNDFGERLQQAHRYIGNIESYIRKQALGSTSQDEQDRAFMPVQQMVHDIITVYLHTKDEVANDQSTRDRLFIDVADAIKAVSSVHEDARPGLRELIAAVMEERFLGDSTLTSRLLQSDDAKKSFLQLKIAEKQAELQQEALAEFDTRRAAATSEAAREAIELEREQYIREAAAVQNPLPAMPHQTFLNAASALKKFELSGDPNVDEIRKAEILAYLGAQDRIHKLERKTVYKIDGQEVNGQSLYHQFLRIYDEDPTDPTFAPEQWAVLGSWAAELYLDDITARSSSTVPATGALLGDAGATVQRYFDQSFTYLTDTLFDPKVLEAADKLSQSGMYTQRRDSTEVAKMLTEGPTALLSDKRIGTWTEVVVNESMKARMILKNSTVGAAVAQEGNDPKVMADYIGAGQVTWKLPEPGHFTSVTLNGSKEQRLGTALSDPMSLVKLQNHFVRRVTIQSTDEANPLDPALAEALAAVASVNHTSAETVSAGQIRPGNEALRVLDLAKLDSQIEWLKSNHQLGDWTVEIEYVDVDKKPHEREWANNIFFDGVGREAVGGSGMGAIASLFFGLNGLSKVGQQNPLDAATKQGMSFRAHKRSSLLEVETLERAGAKVSQVLGAKALHMLDKSYPTGDLLQADLPSLYKLMKMRHVIVGTNANGEKEVWWPEKMIALEESGADIPLQNPRLVQLSDRVAQTLLGRSGAIGVKGTRGSLVRPTFNIYDLDIFPSLDNARLEELGLERLGEEAELGNTRLAQVTLPPREVATYEKGKTYVSLYKQRLKEWRGELQKVNTRRSENRDRGAGKLDVEQINQVNSQLVIDMLDAERQAVGAGRLGMPKGGVTDLGALEVSSVIAGQLSRSMETENSMFWVYKHGDGGDLTKGWLGRADIDNNYAGMNGMGPVFGDTVVLDLTEIQAATDINSYQEAADEAAAILEKFTERGLGVILQSSRGQFDLREAVTERLMDGSVGYRPMSESGHVFLPITEDATYNAAQRALATTLLETPQFSTKNMALRFVADGVSSNLTEATEYIDVRHDPAITSISHTILPMRLLSTGGVDRRIPLAFNIPQRGVGQSDQLSEVNSQLLGMLTDPSGEGREYLKKLLGPENTRYPQYIEHPNGTIEHGVLPLDDALDRLQQTLQTQKWPLDPGETFYTGTIVPFIGGDGSIHLSRVGFQQPNHRQMGVQREIRYGDRERKFTASLPTLDPNQHRPPPTTVDELRTDSLGLSVLGTFRPNPLGKSISEGLGLKTGQTPMPPGYSFPPPIAAPNAIGARVTGMVGNTSVVGKEAGQGTVNNFRDAFMAMGVNFEDDMIDFMFGENAARSSEERNRLWDLAQRALKMWAAESPQYTAVQLSRMLDNRSAMVALEARFNAIGKTVAPDTWTGVKLGWDKDTPQPPKDRLGTIMLTALAAPGVRLEHVISTPGLTTVTNRDSYVRLMPPIFTDALNDVAHPDLRRMLINRLNRNMPVDPDSGELLSWFSNDLKFNMQMTQETDGGPRKELVTGFLQVRVPIPADENSIRQSYASLESGGPESKHIADTIAGSGGRLMPKARKPGRENIPDTLDELYGDNAIERFEDPDDGAAAFAHLMTRIRVDSPTYRPWARITPMEDEHLTKIQGKVRQYTYRGERTKETGWSPEQVTAGNRLAMDFLKRLNITDKEAVREVEYLVRQLFGIPGPAAEQDDYHEHLTFKFFQAGIEYMTRNIEKGLHPLEGGKVPLEHQAFWKMVFDAQRDVPKASRWVPLSNGNKVKEYAEFDNWGQWVTALHGQMRASHKAFDSRFRPDLDGFFRTYQGTHPDYMEMAISTDEQIAAKLLHPETNREFISIDPGYDAVLRDPIVLASRYMTYDALVGQGQVFTLTEAEETTESVITQRLEAMTAWQKGEGLPKQKDLTIREYAKQGAAYQESTRNTNALMRTLTNMSVITRLFNPALYVSAMFEVPFRSALEGATNVLTGQLTGIRGQLVSGAAERLGLEQRYSVDDVNRLNQLNSSLGESNKFLGLVYGELAYQTVIGGGHGRAGRALEYSAGAVARLTADPRWPMKQTSLAKRYNDAALEHLTLTNSLITTEQYTFLMMQDPEWLMKEYPEAHQMALNAVKQARGAKSTMMGNLVMSPIDKMAKSENLLVNSAGHLLKIPFLFTRFNANMLITLSGLSGLDQMTAMFFDGRQRPQLIKRLMNRAKQGEHDVNTPEYWDNTDVLESIDLSRAFVRGAVTQTGLMTMAMLASGFSLGGEDDEERRRKRLATYLNTPYYHDPNKASNDFRWTEAIFLDNVPVLSSLYLNETKHSAVVPHWIFRQFLSPILGMMRFFETGNSLEIAHGFYDAASVLPTSVLRLKNEADLTHQLLVEAAADDGMIPEKEDKVRQLFTNIVFVYEKALIENAFINGLYQAADDYDRNPWAIQQMANGTIVREQGTNEPVATEALRTVPTEGEGPQALKDKYMTRTGGDALMHQYAEGNATAAVLMSILPWVQGQDTTYLRGNMVTKKQYVQLDPTPKDQIQALVYAAYLGRGGQDFVTKEEIIGQIKQREQAAGRYWKQHEVEAEADKIYATLKDKPLTIFDKTGKEVMSQDGKSAVFRSLRDGVIKLDDPAIRGFNVSQAERDAIAEEITSDLVQEGVDLGLSDQAAKFRMRRIWYGDSTNPSAPGLREILYDKKIPSKPYAEYDQLNVTYTLGPDGKPWATPFQRANVAQVLGIPMPHTMPRPAPGTTYDQRGNVVDLVRGINTGLAAIVPRPVATDIEANDDAVEKAEAKKYTPGGSGYTRRPWRNFGRRRFGGFGGFGGGGGGFGGGGFGPQFRDLRALPGGVSARVDDVQNINVNNPIIRRADVRRERITSERGRLKQWQ